MKRHEWNSDLFASPEANWNNLPIVAAHQTKASLSIVLQFPLGFYFYPAGLAFTTVQYNEWICTAVEGVCCGFRGLGAMPRNNAFNLQVQIHLRLDNLFLKYGCAVPAG